MTCLVVVIVVAVLIATSVYNFSKTSDGKKLFSSMNSALGQVQKLAPCIEKMKAANDALHRYRERNGSYPPTLAALLPDYLGGNSPLHVDLDPNPDPSHVSFKYTPPAADAPGATPVLSFQYSYTLDIGVQKNHVDAEIVMLLDGRTEQNQTQTLTVPAEPATPGAPPQTRSITQTIHTGADGKVTVTTTPPPRQ
jgi:hypothetical protein